MYLLTIKLIISLLVFQSYANSGNRESKISVASNFKKKAVGIILPHVTQDTIPPLPPMPPLDKKSIVKASKLASDYIRNRSLADKQYKKKTLITVEGIVKEIKEIDYLNYTIILDGAPSKIDLQFDNLTPRRIRNLKKGMKATFLAHCDGLNGNIIFSECIYIEKPAYE